MKLAAALIVAAAGVTAAFTHHDDAPATAPIASNVIALDPPAPLKPRVSRYLNRRPLHRRRHHAQSPWRPVHDWSGVAACESTGRWHLDSGNHFYGGLQMTQSTWLAFGGARYAVRADYATELEQQIVAERVLATQGAGAWPICNRYLRGA